MLADSTSPATLYDVKYTALIRPYIYPLMVSISALHKAFPCLLGLYSKKINFVIQFVKIFVCMFIIVRTWFV